MFLHQEYLKRHKIDAGWMGYPKTGSLVFRSIDPNRHRWLLLSFRREGPDYHPQEYIIHTTIPKRDNGQFRGYQKNYRIKWDEFEIWLKRYVTNAHKLRMVKNFTEKQLTLWEIFVYCNDQWFAEWGHSYKKTLFKTLDLNSSLKERKKHFEHLMEVMSSNASYAKMRHSFETNLSQFREDGWIEENGKKLLHCNGQ